jgi:hypothetical protein
MFTDSDHEGDIAEVSEFYFDNNRWTIRYLVTKTRNWRSGRKFLISLIATKLIDRISWSEQKKFVSLLRAAKKATQKFSEVIGISAAVETTEILIALKL